MNSILSANYIKSTIRTNAQNAVKAIDSNNPKMVEIAAKHMQNCINYPTAGKVALKTELAKLQNKMKYKDNATQLEIDPKIKNLENLLKIKIDKLYKKTNDAREFILNSHRISFDKTIPVKHDLTRFLFKTFGIGIFNWLL